MPDFRKNARRQKVFGKGRTRARSNVGRSSTEPWFDTNRQNSPARRRRLKYDPTSPERQFFGDGPGSTWPDPAVTISVGRIAERREYEESEKADFGKENRDGFRDHRFRRPRQCSPGVSCRGRDDIGRAGRRCSGYKLRICHGETYVGETERVWSAECSSHHIAPFRGNAAYGKSYDNTGSSGEFNSRMIQANSLRRWKRHRALTP